MRWEALAINADFWSQVLQGRSLAPLDFALGAVVATRRGELAAIGGFEALADFLADDYQLGNRIARIAKKRIALCPVVVDCLSAPMNWREVWAHQLRWARTIRVSKPLPYFRHHEQRDSLAMLWVLTQPCKWSVALFAGERGGAHGVAQRLQSRLGKVPGQGFYFWLALHEGLAAIRALGDGHIRQRNCLARSAFGFAAGRPPAASRRIFHVIIFGLALRILRCRDLLCGFSVVSIKFPRFHSSERIFFARMRRGWEGPIARAVHGHSNCAKRLFHSINI